MVTEFLEKRSVGLAMPEEKYQRLCVGMVFNQGGTPISLYGFDDTFNVCLLAGFAYAVKSICKYLSSSLPSMNFEECKKIQNNFLNSGFYLCQFENQYDGNFYGFITRPIDDASFSESWINEILIGLVKKLEISVDVVEASIKIFNSFDEYLKNEIKFIHLIKKYERKINSCYELIFRNSGIYAGSLDDPVVKRIYQFILSGLKIDNQTEFRICGKIYCVTKEKFGFLEYFKLVEKIEE
ncbi:MAG: hypothetical protein ACTSO9_15885 [Candidatus Helarchaeota archaeon]